MIKKVCCVSIGLFTFVLLPLCGWGSPYRSLNEMCIVEKKEGKYWFLNGKELSAKVNQIFETQRNQYEWFFTENGQIKAKVYPALRDAVIKTPDELYKQIVEACPLTDTNQKLATQVSFKYTSHDNVCACIFEQNRINCAINEDKLSNIPYGQWVLFFETGGYPSVISGVVPSVLSKAWIEIPDDYIQAITPCSNNTSNQEIVKRLEPQLRNLK